MAEERSPPLVSPRSPSNARAQADLEDPELGDAGVIAALQRLYEAHDNARRAYAAAAGRLSDQRAQQELRAAAVTLGAHGERVAELIEGLGGLAPRPDEVRDVLAHGAEDVARAADHAAVQAAIQAVDEDLAAARREARATPGLSPDVAAALE